MKNIIVTTLFVLLLLVIVSANEHEIEIGIKEQDVSSLINKELNKNTINVAKAKINKEDGGFTIEIQDGGYLQIGKRLYSNLKGGSAFFLDNNGKLKEADIITNNNGGVYTFEQIPTKITVPPNTRLIYDGASIELYGKNKEFILGDDTVKLKSDKLNLIGHPTEIILDGEEFIFSGILIKENQIWTHEDGFLVQRSKSGSLIFKDVMLDLKNKNSVLIFKEEKNCQSYKEFNCIVITDKVLDINALNTNTMKVKILEGNKILNTNKKNRFEISSQGARIKFHNKDKIPKMEVDLKEGNDLSVINIINGRLRLDMNKKQVHLSKDRILTTEHYQSTQLKAIFSTESECSQFIFDLSNHIWSADCSAKKFPFSTTSLLNPTERLEAYCESLECLNKKFNPKFSKSKEKIKISHSLIQGIERFLIKQGSRANFLKQIIIKEGADAVTDIKKPSTPQFGNKIVEVAGEDHLLEKMEHEIFGHGFLLNTQKNEELLSNIDPKHKIQTLIDDIGKQNIIRIKEFCKNNDEIDLCKLKDFNAVISGFYDYEKLKILRKFDNLIKKQVGLGFHSLDNYGEDSYPEVYAEYREQSIDRRTILANKKDLNKEYSYPTNVYRRLTQICLDINDCTKDEYEKIMKVKCRTQECIEFRCIEYKLLCCRNFKNSPNCG